VLSACILSNGVSSCAAIAGPVAIFQVEKRGKQLRDKKKKKKKKKTETHLRFSTRLQRPPELPILLT
jgi:hypothetical protein